MQGFRAVLPEILAHEQSLLALKTLAFKAFGFVQYALPTMGSPPFYNGPVISDHHSKKYDEDTRILKSYALDDKKVGKARRESGFFANTTHGLDMDAMTAQHHYSLRDEQEKYFAMMKGILGADRQRNSSELGKEGRLFILFVAQIIGC